MIAMPQLKPVPKEILQLRSTYQTAQLRLVNIIATSKAKGNVTAYREAILRQVEKEIRVLDKFAKRWTTENIDKYYNRGAEGVYSTFRRANIDIGDIAVDPRRIQIIAANAYGEFTDAHRFVGRVINDEIRQAGVEAIAEKLSAGDTVKQAKKNLVNKLTDKGITGIRDRRGRMIRLDAYAEMVARSTTREATNLATMDQLQELNHDLVQMSDHASPCEICAPLEGRVYSISGSSPDYPPLDIAHGEGFANIHPNCKHVLTPYIAKFDPNQERTKQRSQRPFDTDPRSQRQREAYERAQRQNALLRNDRNQWERYRMTMPNDTPRTFSAFRRSKTAGGPKYKELESKYRSMRIKAASP